MRRLVLKHVYLSQLQVPLACSAGCLGASDLMFEEGGEADERVARTDGLTRFMNRFEIKLFEEA